MRHRKQWTVGNWPSHYQHTSYCIYTISLLKVIVHIFAVNRGNLFRSFSTSDCPSSLTISYWKRFSIAKVSFCITFIASNETESTLHIILPKLDSYLKEVTKEKFCFYGQSHYHHREIQQQYRTGINLSKKLLDFPRPPQIKFGRYPIVLSSVV